MKRIKKCLGNNLLVFIMVFILQQVNAQEEPVTIGVNIANKLEVALGVGPTSVDYSTFEADIRALLSLKNPAVPKEDLIITAAKAVSANTTSEFSWWTYDHTRPSSDGYGGVATINDVTHIYSELSAAATSTASATNLQNGAGVDYAPGVWGLPSTSGSIVNTVGAANYCPGIGYQYADKNTYNVSTYPAAGNPTAGSYPIEKHELNPDPTNPDLAHYNTTNTRRLRHPYLGNNTHMFSSNNGATMDFYGYPQNAYRDWQFLPNNQKTMKIFEFSIAEDRAFDALDGIGFFFNTEVNGSYTAGTQTMSGYLLFLQYSTTGVGSNITIYKFKDINTKNFHHEITGTTSSSAQYTVAGYTGTNVAPSTSNQPKFIPVARSTIYTPTDLSRRIRIEASPSQVKVYYNGSTVKNAAAVLDPDNPGYQELTDLNLVNFNTTTLTVTGLGAVTLQTGSTIAMDQNYIGPDKANDADYGFGPMAAYLAHGCARPTHIAFQNLSMIMDQVRSLTEVVREPNWQENTKKFLVNLNEEPIEDFSSTSITAELLARLRNDDIYYIGWCSNQNAEASQDFLTKNDLKGTIVNIEAPGMPTYEQQIQSIADEIYKRYWQNNEDYIVLVTENVIFDVTGAEQTNTADPEWPSGKWMVFHSVDGSGVKQDTFDNDDGIYALSGQYVSDLDLQFNKAGTYDIYYRSQYIVTVIAHKAPVATFQITLNDDIPGFIDNSYDPDDTADGIVSSAWSYINVDKEPSPTTGLTLADLHAALPTLIEGDIYLIILEVEDKYGATAMISKQIRYVENTETEHLEPPFAYFDIAPYTILKGVGNQKIVLTDGSYDLQGLPVTSAFTLTKDDSPYTYSFVAGDNDVSVLPVGEYMITLVVNNGYDDSVPVTRAFSMIEDTTPPTAIATPASGSFTANASVTVTFSDTGGSGLKDQKVIVTNSTTTPAPSDPGWTLESASSSRIVKINTAGNNYIHWEANDNAGNTGYGYFGLYTLTKQDVTLSLTTAPAISATYPTPVVLTASFAENDPYPTGNIYFYVDDELIGSATIVNGETSRTYVYTEVTPLPIGNITFSVSYLGDGNYNAANKYLSYTIFQDATASVTVDGQTDKTYDGEPFEPAGINVTGTSSYKIEYVGRDDTIYPLSITPPANAGKYTLIVTTTDPGYVDKSDHADFEIYKREITLLLSANPNATASAMSNVALTATISNATDFPEGTVKFSQNGTQIGSNMPIILDGNYIADITWPSVIEGEYILKAEYIATTNDNYAVSDVATIEYTVTKLAQTGFDFTIDGPGEFMYGDDNFFVSATGGQTESPPTYSVTEGSGVISVDPVTGEVTILNAGTAVITAMKSGDNNYDQVIVTKTIKVYKRPLTIKAEDVTIDYGDIPVLAYTITSGNLVNDHDVLSGALATENMGNGVYAIVQGTLTADNNYEITFIEGTLIVISVNLSITDIIVDGQTVQCSENSFHTVAECGATQAYVNITADPAATVIIDGVEQNPRSVDLLNFGDNIINITITAQGNLQTYTLTVVRYYDRLEYEYADVPTFNCDLQSNGGYDFKDFQWYRDGVVISGDKKPYYRINDNAIYYCEFLSDGRKWRTCDIQHTLHSTSSLKAYPNPTQGQVTLSNDERLSTGKIQVFDIFGRLVMQPYTNPFDMSHLTEGVYVIKVDGETVRVIVKK